MDFEESKTYIILIINNVEDCRKTIIVSMDFEKSKTYIILIINNVEDCRKM